MEDLAHTQNISSLTGEERQLNSHTVDTVQGETIHVSSQVLLFYASVPNAHSTKLACLLRTERFNGQLAPDKPKNQLYGVSTLRSKSKRKRT